MNPPDILWVARGSPSEEVGRLLRQAGLTYRVTSAAEAIRLVTHAGGHTVLCERVRGWPLLLSVVEESRGAAVLFRPKADTEDAGVTAPGVEVVEEADRLVGALERAQHRRPRYRRELSLRQEYAGRLHIAELINRLSSRIAEHGELNSLGSEVVVATQELCDADATALFLVDSESGQLSLAASSTYRGAPLEPTLRLAAGQGVVGRVALTATPLLAVGAQAEDATLASVVRFTAWALLAVPLLRTGDVQGVLCAFRKEERPFQDENVRALEGLARHVSSAVHNVQTTLRLREAQAVIIAANTDLELKVRERTQLLERAKQEWEHTFDLIKEPLAVQDGFIVRRANLAYAQRAARSIREVIGKPCHELLAGRDSPCPGCPLLEGRGSPPGEVIIRKETVFHVSTFWNSSQASDDRVIVHYRDITGQKVLEARLRESERLAALGQLASGAAHEINNPLGFMTSNLGSLKARLEELACAAHELVEAHQQGPLGGPLKLALDRLELEETAREGLEIVEESLDGARRVGVIVRGLRELSRLEVGKLEATDVNASVTRVARAELGGHPGVELELKAGRFAWIAPLQLDQVLTHLVRNALQATPLGQRISIRTRAEGEEIFVEIRDEGSGISPENLHRVFEPFFTTRGIGKGIGLGLTAAYGIVKRNGGTLDARSEPGAGSTFTVRLKATTNEEKGEPATFPAP